MRRRGRQHTLASESRGGADPRVASAYDWMQFGRHRLRAPASVVVDLPFPRDQTSHAWIATAWPDADFPGCWARQPWQPHPAGRGWVLPQQLAAGDVLEFGTHTVGGWRLWHGVLDAYDFDGWLTVQGPYPDAAAAHDDAQRILAADRFLPALAAGPHHVVQPVSCKRDRRCQRRGSSDDRRDGQQHR